MFSLKKGVQNQELEEIESVAGREFSRDVYEALHDIEKLTKLLGDSPPRSSQQRAQRNDI